MPRLKLTKTAVDRLRAPDPSRKQTIYWDTEHKGFGVLVSGTKGTKTYIVQRDLPGGRARRVTVAQTNVLSFDEALTRAKDKLADFYRGIDPKHRAKVGTLRQVLEAYLRAKHAATDADFAAGVNNLRKPTVRAYRSAVERYLAAWANRPLADITHHDVEERHEALATEAGTATANSVMRTLRVLWNWAAKNDPDLPQNPVRLGGRWYPQPRRETIVPADKLPAFYKAVRGLPNKVASDYLVLLLFTGLRRTEAATLTWSDIDLTDKVIRVPAAHTKAGRKLDLPMSDVVFDLLSSRRELGDSGYVFPSTGRSGHIAEPKFFLAEVAKSTGIDVSAHDLRRTFISVAASTDITPWSLKALVNHSLGTGDVTAGYIQITVDQLRRPAQQVTDRIKLLCKLGN